MCSVIIGLITQVNKETKFEKNPEMLFAKMEGKCYCSGKGWHKSPSCRLKDKIPEEEWAINKAKSKDQSHINTETSKILENTSKSETTQSSTLVGWSVAHVKFYQAEEIQKWKLLDNGSIANLICNPSLVKNKKNQYLNSQQMVRTLSLIRKQQFPVMVKSGINQKQ